MLQYKFKDEFLDNLQGFFDKDEEIDSNAKCVIIEDNCQLDDSAEFAETK